MINYEQRITWGANLNLRLQLLKSSLCDYSKTYILLKVRITTEGVRNNPGARKKYERKTGVIVKKIADHLPIP